MDTPAIKAMMPKELNEFGEAPLPHAPHVTLGNGTTAIPQQFFHYERSVDNVEKILSYIDFHDNFPLFTFAENGHIFIQVGIVGHENYPPLTSANQAARNSKIVYGRKWFIEPYTPTSEVIQTAYLAINKVREHEIRELLTLNFEHQGYRRKATPFNTHIDLPLAANNTDLFNNTEDDISPFEFEQRVGSAFSHYRFGCYDIVLEEATLIHKPYWLIAAHFKRPDRTEDTSNTTDIIAHYFPELLEHPVYFVTRAESMSCLLHGLMNAIIKKAEEHVAETFTFKDFPRFSRKISPDQWATFSVDTRIIKEQRSEEFNQLFKKMVHLVDSGKAPVMATDCSLYEKQNQSIAPHTHLEGYLPR